MEKRLSEFFFSLRETVVLIPEISFQGPLSGCQLAPHGYWSWNEVVGLGGIQRPQWPRRGGMLGTGKLPFSWWRHQMETFSVLLAICAGNSPVHGEFHAQRTVTRSFSLICVWINGWVNNRGAGDLRCYLAHYDVTVMFIPQMSKTMIKVIYWSRNKMVYNLQTTFSIALSWSKIVINIKLTEA